MSAPAARPAGPNEDTDPVEEHAAALSAALHGPPRAKARMVREIRDGLADSVAAHAALGLPYRRAAEEAVREFGAAEELAPACQRELTIAQTRRTAGVVAVTSPFLIACWYLIVGAELPPAARLTAALLAAVAAGAALLAAGTLAATGALARRLPTPDRLPLAVAWTGTVASVAMALATLTLAVAGAASAAWPLLALAGALTVTSHGLVAASARACRRCARAVPG
ncbi:permease prefix domain 1-containing protein [Streptomyces sp. MP131-18]|uniref:permease prefix domain 1-containing protein n=1 Tax=Streptomyces sp. MP131-18 TaxID=1857892 RepID=UPI00097C0B88|nr:permease prefix domain 1-containing protein [Streptomyces sp. MP131-18]ONK11395.1 hypothetical protein STBA_21270 [Streptomyces sp. MP131-18]